MQYLLEHFGITVAAITGVLAARGKEIDLFGVIVLALVTAFGGGTIRDLMVGDLPVVWVRDSRFFVNALVTAVAVFFVARGRDLPGTALMVADAFALALFTVIGVRKALAAQVTPSVAVAMGVITGVAGGIVRDLLTGEIPLVFRREIYLYATAAFVGGVAHVLMQAMGCPDRWRMAGATALILGMRLAGIRWRLALPVFTVKRPDPGPGGVG